MLKRFIPTQPNGVSKIFSLPSTYIGGDITLFVNGQLEASRNEVDSPYGYSLDEVNKTFEFYQTPYGNDNLYVIYDDDGTGTDTGSTTGLMRLSKGYNLISYQGAQQARWDNVTHQVVYETEILANVKNLIIDQIEDIYGVPAETIVREIQTYTDDTQTYFTYRPDATGKSWTGDAEHVLNVDLYRPADVYEFGDPDDSDYVAYTPDNFILSNCKLDASFSVISLDQDNSITDLPSGLRTGIHIFIYETADLSSTADKLELRF